MEKFLKVYFNRLAIIFYIFAIAIVNVIWCNPYINVLIIIFSTLFYIGFTTYILENKKLTSGERLIYYKLRTNNTC